MAAVHAPACFVGLDSGTTNTRAWLVREGRVVASERSSVGIRDVVVGGRPVLVRALRELLERLTAEGERAGASPELVLAAGMITSEQGIAEVPHLAAPTGAVELSRAIRVVRAPEVCELPIHLVPGIRTAAVRLEPERIGEADVMRGEETLCVGLHALAQLPPDSLLVNLGSHWKTVRLDAGGRIAGSRTALTGELLHAAQTRTILAAAVPGERPASIDPRWARLGAEEARRDGVERALFCVRLLQQRTDSTPAQRLSFLVGAFAGSAVPRLLQDAESVRRVVVAGGGPVGAILVDELGRAGITAVALAPGQVDAAMVAGFSVLLGLSTGKGNRATDPAVDASGGG